MTAFIFFFDHSSGHDRLRPDGLNSNGLNKYYGGGQQKMRKSNIKDKTYLGPFPSQLSIGDTQSFQFEATDEGPFHLSDEERMQRRFDFETGEKEIKNYTRSTLIKKIKENTNLDQVTGNVKEIREIAKAHNVPTSFERNKVKEGWMGKPKGMLQILFERGFFDPSDSIKEIVRNFAANGKKDKDGNLIQNTSLKEIVANLPDFKSEITLLQYRALQLGVTVDCSPKYHPEIAGEGIEYCWALGKNKYRRENIKDKRTKSKYLELVEKCTDNKTVITKQLVWMFGKRQRRYMLSCLALDRAKEQQSNVALGHNADGQLIPEMSCSLVERIIRVHKAPKKTHRNIRDQEKKYLDDIVEWMKKCSNAQEEIE